MSAQTELFPLSKKTNAKENLKRVRSRLEVAILDFFRSLDRYGEFHAEELLHFIGERGITCAPDSPGRIMRLLKKEHEIDYTLVSRKGSLYKILPK